MAITVGAGGWVTEVNGIPVTKRELPRANRYAGWKFTRPTGILEHYTAGCGSDIFQTLLSRGISCHFNVDREGKLYQYVSLHNAAAHAFDASHRYFGIEHSALPGTCNLTSVQKDASVRLNAGLVEYTKRRWNFDIPLRHVPGCNLTPGFKEHKDGTGCAWNPNGHVDNPVTRWGTWETYLGLISTFLPEVYTFEGKRYERIADVLRAVRTRLQVSKAGDAHTIRVRRA